MCKKYINLKCAECGIDFEKYIGEYRRQKRKGENISFVLYVVQEDIMSEQEKILNMN